MKCAPEKGIFSPGIDLAGREGVKKFSAFLSIAPHAFCTHIRALSSRIRARTKERKTLCDEKHTKKEKSTCTFRCLTEVNDFISLFSASILPMYLLAYNIMSLSLCIQLIARL